MSDSNTVDSGASSLSADVQQQQQTTTSQYDIPRWRFVAKAKKTEGYSSNSAGQIIEGKSASELSSDSIRRNPLQYKQRVSIDNNNNVDERQRSNYDYKDGYNVGTQDINAQYANALQEEQQQAVEYLHKLQLEADKLEQTKAQLQSEIHTAQLQKETIQEAQDAMRQAESIEKEAQTVSNVEVPVRHHDEGNSNDTALDAAAVLGVIENEVEATHQEDVNAQTKDRNKKIWMLYIVIFILICGIASLLGVMLSGGDNDTDSNSNLRGSEDEDQLQDGSQQQQQQEDVYPIEVSPSSPLDENDTTDEMISSLSNYGCPINSKHFDLSIQLTNNPSDVKWSILDICTNTTMYNCTSCYKHSPSNYPVSFAGCLPTYYTYDTNQTVPPKQQVYREYVLDVIGLDNSYTFRYDGVVVYNVGQDDRLYFGSGGITDGGVVEKCTSFSSGSKQQVSNETIVSAPINTTLEIDNEVQATEEATNSTVPTIKYEGGCSPYTEDSNTCGRNAELEFKLLMPRNNDTYDDQLFGSASTFVGNDQSIVAVASGSSNKPVHIYRKSELIIDDGDTNINVCILITTLNNQFGAGNVQFSVNSGNGHVPETEEGKFYEAGEVVLDKCYGGSLPFTIQVTSPGPDGWRGSVLYSYDGKVTYKPYECIDGCIEGDTNLAYVLSVDNGDGITSESVNCLNGSLCTLKMNADDILSFGSSRTSSWQYLTSISLPQDALTSDDDMLFGTSLDSNSEGYLAVGALGNTTSGAVYIYKPNLDMTEWTLDSRLDSTSPSFGSAISMDGTMIAIGSPDERDGIGSVYIYEHSGIPNQENSYILSFVIKPEDLGSNSHFGSSVSLFGTTLAVGAPYDMNGSVYMFTRSPQDAWLPQKIVAPLDMKGGRGFGSHMVLSGCTVAVSSPQDVSLATLTLGTIRTFQYDENEDSWNVEQIVEPANDQREGVFGECFALEGDIMLVSEKGKVYSFGRIGGFWSEISSVRNSADEFGCPLILSDKTFVVGATEDDSLGMNSGSSFVYNLCPVEPV